MTGERGTERATGRAVERSLAERRERDAGASLHDLRPLPHQDLVQDHDALRAAARSLVKRTRRVRSAAARPSSIAAAARWDATLIGINNRDLATFAVSLATTERLAAAVPPGALVVAESGIRSAEDVHRMIRAGAHAVLVGEAFMDAADPGAALAEWLACR